MTQLLLDLEPPARPCFENFIAGRNAEALAAVRRLCETSPADHAPRFIYLWGDTGSGRSHLLRSASALVGGHYFGAALGAVDVRSMIASEPVAARRRVLIVDDVESTDAATQEALFHAYNVLRDDSRGAMLVAGDRAPRDLALHAGRDDLRSRLAWGLAYQLHPLDDHEKDAALVRHAAERGFPLAPEVRRFLMTHFARDLGSLMQLVEALDRHAREQRRVVTLPLIRDFLHRDFTASIPSAH